MLDEFKTGLQNHCILAYVLGVKSLRKVFEFVKKLLHPRLFMKVWHVFENRKDISCQGYVISCMFHKAFNDVFQIRYTFRMLVKIIYISLVTFGKIFHYRQRFTSEAKLYESRKCKDAILG